MARKREGVETSLLGLAIALCLCRPVVGQQPNTAAAAAENLVELLRRKPAEPSTAAGRIGLYVIFLMNPGNPIGAIPGLHIMNSDGTDRRRLDGHGRPKWSHDGHQFLIITFGEPREVTVIDARPDRKSGLLKVPDRKFFSPPSWAGEGIVVAITGEEAGDAVVLIDVTNPGAATVTETLWKRGQDLEMKPLSPVYSPETKTCVFVGEQEGKGLALYSIQRGKPGPPRPLEAEGFDNVLQSLSFSPAGRFVAFSSDRPDRRKAVNHPRGRRP